MHIYTPVSEERKKLENKEVILVLINNEWSTLLLMLEHIYQMHPTSYIYNQSEVHKDIFSRYRLNDHLSSLNRFQWYTRKDLLYKEPVNSYVFCPLTKIWIWIKIQCWLIITHKFHKTELQNFNSCNKCFNWKSSKLDVLDLATIKCVLLFHELKFPPIKRQ